MELSSPWEAASRSATHEIPSILWNKNDHYHIHKSLPIVSILRQLNPVNILNYISLGYILILPFQLCLGLPSGLLPWGFFMKTLYVHLFFPMHAKYLGHIILRYLIKVKK
jgi:hypothetical protein